MKKRIKNVPSVDIVKKTSSEDACLELGKFLDKISILKQIDSNKTVRENLQKVQDKYKSKNISKNGEIKLRFKLKVPKIRYKVKHTKGLKVTLQRR